MKKILLMLICLITVSVFAGAAFASSNADYAATNDSIQISENSKLDVSISQSADSHNSNNLDEAISSESSTNQNNDTPSEICRPVGIKPTPEGDNNNDSNGICRPVGIKPTPNPTPVGIATNITERPTHEDNGGNEIVARADPPKEPVIIKRSQNFTVNGTEMFLALIDNGEGPKLVCYKTSSGLNGAGASCVGEAGSDLVKLLEEEGIIHDMGGVIKMFAIEICDYFDWDWPFGDFFDK